MKVRGLDVEIGPEMFPAERRPYIPGAIAAWNRVIGATETTTGERFEDIRSEDERMISFSMFVGGYYEAKAESNTE